MKRKTIGKMSKSRGTWERKPSTQVVENKKAYNRKEKHRGWEK